MGEGQGGGIEEASEMRLYGCPIHDSLSPLGSKMSLFM